VVQLFRGAVSGALGTEADAGLDAAGAALALAKGGSGGPRLQEARHVGQRVPTPAPLAGGGGGVTVVGDGEVEGRDASRNRLGGFRFVDQIKRA